MSEQILVIPTETFRNAGYFTGFTSIHSFGMSPFMSIIDQHGKFVPREDAEQDPELKQIVTYCIVHVGPQVLVYRRGYETDEERLHAKRSIGIGGHVSQIDNEPPSYESCLSTMLRELEEEISLERDAFSVKTLGLLNDDINPVGEVHLGVLYQISLQTTRPVVSGEDGIKDIEFHPDDVLYSWLREKPEEFETWSQIAIQVLHKGQILDDWKSPQLASK